MVLLAAVSVLRRSASVARQRLLTDFVPHELHAELGAALSATSAGAVRGAVEGGDSVTQPVESLERNAEQSANSSRDSARVVSGFRTRQLIEQVYRHGVAEIDALRCWPAALRAQLADAQYGVRGVSLVKRTQSEIDGTTKYLFALHDGATVEAVYIPEEERGTVCISSQSGCSVGCSFCATGAMGSGRNLTTGEIVSQVLAVQHDVSDFPLSPLKQRRASNIVFMGMGEPLYNVKNVMDAASILTHPYCANLSRRKVTISTSGVLPNMLLAACTGVNLAVSLHAPNEALRSELVPINSMWPLRDVVEFCREVTSRSPLRIARELLDGRAPSGRAHLQLGAAARTRLARLLAEHDASVDAWSVTRHDGLGRALPRVHAAQLRPQPVPDAPLRKVMFEYCMLRGVNDSAEHARELVQLLDGIPALVNLIPFNPWPGSAYLPPPNADVERFARIVLGSRTLSVTYRVTRGQDIQAACGQLSTTLRKREAASAGCGSGASACVSAPAPA